MPDPSTLRATVERVAVEPCDNCGLRAGSERQACGHWYCMICLGRGRQDDGCLEAIVEERDHLRDLAWRGWEAYEHLQRAYREALVPHYRLYDELKARQDELTTLRAERDALVAALADREGETATKDMARALELLAVETSLPWAEAHALARRIVQEFTSRPGVA